MTVTDTIFSQKGLFHKPTQVLNHKNFLTKPLFIHLFTNSYTFN